MTNKAASQQTASDQTDTSTKEEVILGFDELGLSEITLNSLKQAEYHHPSEVQAGVIPLAVAGKDVLGQARTGTGKTAAFALPILEKLIEHKRGNPPRALILVPTRELAVQVCEETAKLAYGRNLTCLPLYGGTPVRAQVTKLKAGADIVVGTPGRVLDHLSRGTLVLSQIEVAVLDEADRMLDIGFRPDIEKILRRCPNARQTLLLSATVAPAIQQLCSKYMIDPVILNFSPKNTAGDTIEQFYFSVEQRDKFELLIRLLHRDKPAQAIVFCRTKRTVDKLYQKLRKHLGVVNCIHGDLVQRARDRVMKQFRAGETSLLIATDVVGRGIDVSSISHIINYDLPQSPEDYVHRVGRTGRMGREGIAYSFITIEEGSELTRIEMTINQLLERSKMDGLQCATSEAPVRASQPAPTVVKVAKAASSFGSGILE